MARAALSPVFAGLRGSLGSIVIVQRPDGPVVRSRVPVRRTTSPAQRENERRMARVGQAWKALDAETFAAWQSYAETQAWRNPTTGAIVNPRAFNLFSGLACKARQVDPTVPLGSFGPPTEAFFGDSIRLTVQASSSSDSGVENGAYDSLPLAPSLADERGGILFVSDRPNAPGIVTEVLIQPLAHLRRKALADKYVSRGFVAFDGEPFTVSVEPGVYALAYRFVRAATGQETAIAPLGVVEVTA